MDRRIEFALIPVKPTLGIELYKAMAEKFSSNNMPEEIKDVFHKQLQEIARPLNIDNLYVYQKLNSMVDALNSLSITKNKLRRFDPIPNELEKLSESYYIIGQVDKVITNIDKEKMCKEHLKECSVHTLLGQVIWNCFIASLYGNDFGVCLIKSMSILDFLKTILLNSENVLAEGNCGFSIN